MKMGELKAKAAELGVSVEKKKKKDLILDIQEAEGHTACFAANDGNCTYTDCCFWDDCKKEYKKAKK